MKTPFPLLTLILALSIPLMAADPTPEELRDAGFAALKAAQADPDQIVQAARLLSQAADAFAKAGKEAEAQELESYLFWAKKKMTIQQIDAFLAKGNGVAKAAVAKMEQIEKKEVKVEESVAWLAKADAYAAKAKDQFLVAVRYFEVASRFKGTPEGETALDKSLKALQQAKVDSKAVAGKAEKGDGKVYVQSKPVGAQILVVQNGELRDTGLKTPSLVQLPVGRAEFVLRLAKHDEAKMNADVTTSISKPEPFVMEPEKFDLEVTAAPELGDAWDVYVDGKPAMDKAGKPAVAPCTVRVAEGVHSVQLAKEGFVDPAAIRVTVKAGENQSVVVKGKAVAGASRVIYSVMTNILNYRGLSFFVEKPNSNEHTIWNFSGTDNTLTTKFGSRGTYSISGTNLMVKFGNTTISVPLPLKEVTRVESDGIVWMIKQLK